MNLTYQAIKAIPLFALFLVSLSFNTTISASTTFLDDTDCTKKEENCMGTRTWKDGRKYVGEFHFGAPQGYGKLIWSDGTIYEGQFKDGLRHGEGFQSNEDGSVYKGNFVNGFMQGKGAYSFACGHEYVGDFYNDKMHGKGTIVFKDGTSYTGQWKNGKPHGKGVCERTDGIQFTGTLKAGLRDGAGQILWTTKEIFDGHWNNNQLNGASTFTFANGDQMKVSWKKGLMIREVCTYIYKKGDSKTFSFDQLLSDKKTADNLAHVLYFDALEQIANKDHASAKMKLTIAKKLVSKDTELFKAIQDQLKMIRGSK